MFNSFDELHAEYARRFGKEWNRSMMSHDEELAFLKDCYELYPVEFRVRDGFKSMSGDKIRNNGRPFEIVSAIAEGEGLGLECLPAFRIRFLDDGQVLQHCDPEEVFDIP